VETFKRDASSEGRVTQISPLGGEKDNVTSFEVKVSIDTLRRTEGKHVANAEIVLAEHQATLIVPEKAVIYDAQRVAWIEVPAPGTPHRTRKKTNQVGFSNGTRTEVVQG